MKLLPLPKNIPAASATSMMSTTERFSSWPWLANCHQPKTLSFRRSDDFFHTANSSIEGLDSLPEPNEEEEEGYDNREDNFVEMVIQNARSEGRLFFEPAGETSSVLAAGLEDAERGEVVAMYVVDSRDPCGDFRMSMEEMVKAHALRGKWHSLEELLRCYLRVNSRTNHAYILRAFVDLLLSPGVTRAVNGGSNYSCICNCDDTNNGSSSEVHSINHSSMSSSPCLPLLYSSSSSCYSSSRSSTCSCHISVIGEAEENSISSTSIGNNSSSGFVIGQPQCVPLSSDAADPNVGWEDSCSFKSSSSSDVWDS